MGLGAADTFKTGDFVYDPGEVRQKGSAKKRGCFVIIAQDSRTHYKIVTSLNKRFDSYWNFKRVMLTVTINLDYHIIVFLQKNL